MGSSNADEAARLEARAKRARWIARAGLLTWVAALCAISWKVAAFVCGLVACGAGLGLCNDYTKRAAELRRLEEIREGRRG